MKKKAFSNIFFNKGKFIMHYFLKRLFDNVFFLIYHFCPKKGVSLPCVKACAMDTLPSPLSFFCIEFLQYKLRYPGGREGWRKRKRGREMHFFVLKFYHQLDGLNHLAADKKIFLDMFQISINISSGASGVIKNWRRGELK